MEIKDQSENKLAFTVSVGDVVVWIDDLLGNYAMGTMLNMWPHNPFLDEKEVWFARIDDYKSNEQFKIPVDDLIRLVDIPQFISLKDT